MTALKPLDTHDVIGVKAGKYPPNKKCSHPECNEDATGGNHHVFPRSFITNSLWFVSIDGADPIPHVTGLCKAHHDDVEEHRAWIKLEDGVFVWYDRANPADLSHASPTEPVRAEWIALGPLNPQPGSREGRPKRKKHEGQERRERVTVSMKVPKDAAEDGAGLLDDLYEELEAALGYDPPRPRYFSTADAFSFALMWVRDNPTDPLEVEQ